jgi:hypothetical protein
MEFINSENTHARSKTGVVEKLKTFPTAKLLWRKENDVWI